MQGLVSQVGQSHDPGKRVIMYSQVPIKQVGPNKRVGWIFIQYSCLSLCLFLSSCFFGAK